MLYPSGSAEFLHHGNLIFELKSRAESELRQAIQDLKPEEAAVLALLRRRLAESGEVRWEIPEQWFFEKAALPIESSERLR
jgi:hypothetical protein